jgi:hypothetical protein
MDNTVERLNQFQKSVIIGAILGDGYLRTIPGRQNALLEINHALSTTVIPSMQYKIDLESVETTRQSPALACKSWVKI